MKELKSWKDINKEKKFCDYSSIENVITLFTTENVPENQEKIRWCIKDKNTKQPNYQSLIYFLDKIYELPYNDNPPIKHFILERFQKFGAQDFDAEALRKAIARYYDPKKVKTSEHQSDIDKILKNTYN